MAQLVHALVAHDADRAVVWLPELDEVAIVPAGAEPQAFGSELAAASLNIDIADVRLSVHDLADADGFVSKVDETSARAQHGLRSGFHMPDMVKEIADPVHWGVVQDLADVHSRVLHDASGGYFPRWDAMSNSVHEDYYAAAYVWVIAFEKLANANAQGGEA